MRDEFDPIFWRRTASWHFIADRNRASLDENNISPTSVWGTGETTECEQSNASKCCQQVTPKRCQRLRLASPWTPPFSVQTRSSPGRGSLWIWARVGFYSTIVKTRGTNAWPHVLWRCVIIFSPIFITNFDLSPAGKTGGGRTLHLIETSNTEPIRSESRSSLQPLTCSWFFKNDSQHCHGAPET